MTHILLHILYNSKYIEYVTQSKTKGNNSFEYNKCSFIYLLLMDISCMLAVACQYQ